MAETRALREYQESEDSPEALATIPVLTREDLTKKCVPYVNELRSCKGTDLLFHEIDTRGIGYIRLIFKLDNIEEALFPYVGILKALLGMVNTRSYSYGELNHEINIQTGGISTVLNTYTNALDLKENTNTIEVKCKAFYDHLPEAFALMKELILTSDFTDTKRLQELLLELKSREQESMTAAGHVTALNRALSYFSAVGRVTDAVNGIEHYRLVDELSQHFEEEKETLMQNLQTLMHEIFCKGNLMVDYTATEEGYSRMPELVEELAEQLFDKLEGKGHYAPKLEKKNEGFKSSAQIQFVCRAGNYRKHGLEYTGSPESFKGTAGL